MEIETLVMRWGAVPNTNERAGGWLPRVWLPGQPVRRRLWAGEGMELEAARAAALVEAREAAKRYTGDVVMAYEEVCDDQV